MIEALLATLPATVASLGAWLAARKEPTKLGLIEVKVDELITWTAKHERRHVLIEGDSR